MPLSFCIEDFPEVALPPARCRRLVEQVSGLPADRTFSAGSRGTSDLGSGAIREQVSAVPVEGRGLLCRIGGRAGMHQDQMALASDSCLANYRTATSCSCVVAQAISRWPGGVSCAASPSGEVQLATFDCRVLHVNSSHLFSGPPSRVSGISWVR